MLDRLLNKHLDAKLIVLVVVTVCALALAISSIGKPIWSPFDVDLDLRYPTDVAAYNDSMVITDDSNRRAVIINDGKVVSFFDTKGLGDDGYFIYHTEVDENYLYLHTVKMRPGSSCIARETIDRYQLDGTFDKTVYVEEVPDTETRTQPALYAPTSYKDKLYIPTYHGGDFSVVEVNADGESTQLWSTPCDVNPYDALYTPLFNYAMCISVYGEMYEIYEDRTVLSDIAEGSFLSVVDLDIIFHEDGDEFEITQLLALADAHAGTIFVSGSRPQSDELYNTTFPGTPYYLHVDAESFVMHWCEAEKGSVFTYDVVNETTTSRSAFPYSTPLIVTNLARVISIGFLALLVAAFVIVYVRNRRKAGESIIQFQTLSVGLIGTALVAATLFFVTIYQDEAREDLINNLIAQASFVSVTSSSSIGGELDDAVPLVNGSKSTDPAAQSRRASLDKIRSYFDNMMSSSNITENPLLYRIFAISDNGDVCHLLDCQDEYQCGEIIERDNDLLPSIQEAFAGTSSHGEATDSLGDLAYTLHPLYDTQGNVCAVLEIDVYLSTFYTSQRATAIEYSMLLFMIAGALYMGLTESRAVYSNGKSVVTALRKRRTVAENDINGLCRLLGNGVFAAANVDSVILVLAAKEMTSSQSMGIDSSMLIGLPVILFGIGQAVGALTFSARSRRLDARQLLRHGAFVEAAMKAGCALCLVTGAFCPFCVFKFIDGIAISLLGTCMYAIPFRIEDEQERSRCLTACSGPETAQSIVVVLIAGYIGQYFGYHAVYAFSVIFGLGVLGLATMLPTGMYFLSPDRARDASRSASRKESREFALKNLRFFLSPSMLVFLLLAHLPSVISRGYNSYLFPLYSANAGFSTTVISNVFVLARVILFLITPITSHIAKALGPWKSVLLSLSFTGLLYLCFAINNTFAWAVVCLFLTAIPWKIGSASVLRDLWDRNAKAQGLSTSQVLPLMRAIESAGNVLQRVYLGVFLSFGVGGACVAIGVYMLASAALYGALVTRTSMVDPAEE